MGTQIGNATGHPQNASENEAGRAKARQPAQSATDKESFGWGKGKKTSSKLNEQSLNVIENKGAPSKIPR